MKINRWLLITAMTTLVVWVGWLMFAPAPWTTMGENWPISLTMVFGSMIAGATCEGGGAVAFPVFTKALHISPNDARLFTLAIQSIGMTAAAITILAMRRRVDMGALMRAGVGGAVGFLLGMTFITPHLAPTVVRVLFTMLQCSFAVTLLLVQRQHEGGVIRGSNADLSDFRATWILLLTGFLGGIVSSLFGHGLDLLTFSVMVLLFRVDERIATPTTVVLMASNSLVGFAASLAAGLYTPQVMGYWVAAIPIVVVGAPVGAIICRYLTRIFIVRMLVSLIAVELITTIWLIPMRPQELLSAALGLGLFVVVYLAMIRCERYWPAVGNRVKWADAS